MELDESMLTLTHIINSKLTQSTAEPVVHEYPLKTCLMFKDTLRLISELDKDTKKR